MRERDQPFSVTKTVQQGWECMVAGQYQAARERFASAAQADPSDQEARDGLLEALKAKSALYRMSLRLGMRIVESSAVSLRLTPMWFAIIFSAALGVFKTVAKQYPSAAPILWLIAVVVFLLFLLLQYADYESTLRVWFSEYRWLAMTKWDLLISTSGLTCVASCCACLILFVLDHHFAYIMGAMLAHVLTQAVDKVRESNPFTPRIIMYAYLIATAIVGSITIVVYRITTEGTSATEKIPAQVGWVFLVFIAAVALCGSVANVVSLLDAKTEFIDNTTHASRLAGLTLSNRKFRAFHPEVFGLRGLFHKWLYPDREMLPGDIRRLMRERLRYGDAQPAVVVSIDPLWVAAYSEDMDCVALLEFDERFVVEFVLGRGSRLLSVNAYSPDPNEGEDLVIGENAHRGWQNFSPLIAEFVSDDMPQIDTLKRDIPRETWEHAARLGVARMKDETHPPRNGLPLFSHVAAEA